MAKNTDKLTKLPIEFYEQENVVQIAHDLIGKIITTNIEGIITSARIVETEAYVGISDKASHAFAGRRTLRNEHMYAAAGIAYVYICYGMHQMFNVVTNKKEVPDAVLVRAAEPMLGMEDMLIRTRKQKADYTITRGPGNMAKALGINKIHSGINLLGDIIFIMQDEHLLKNEVIAASKRIGIDSAGADALLPYRFFIKGNKYVSSRPR